MRAIIKSVIKSVENEWIRNKWGNTTYNVLSVRYTTRVFLIWPAFEKLSTDEILALHLFVQKCLLSLTSSTGYFQIRRLLWTAEIIPFAPRS